MASYKIGVGIESREHDFVGEAMMIRRTSSAETFRNPWHFHQCLLERYQLSVPKISESPQLRVLKELAHCSNLSPSEIFIEDSDFHNFAGFHFSCIVDLTCPVTGSKHVPSPGNICDSAEPIQSMLTCRQRLLFCDIYFPAVCSSCECFCSRHQTMVTIGHILIERNGVVQISPRYR